MVQDEANGFNHTPKTRRQRARQEIDFAESELKSSSPIIGDKAEDCCTRYTQSFEKNNNNYSIVTVMAEHFPNHLTVKANLLMVLAL